MKLRKTYAMARMAYKAAVYVQTILTINKIK